MHDRQQHVRIASEISVMRNLHKFHKDPFLGWRYLMFIFNVNEGGLLMFIFFLPTSFKFSTFLF